MNIESKIDDPWSREEAAGRRDTRHSRATHSSAYYASDVFSRPEILVRDYVRRVNVGDVPEHDTFVGTGVSGTTMAAILAVATGKMYAVLRKEEEFAHSHAAQPLDGMIGERWVFVDDFIGRGTTRNRVKEAVAQRAPYAQFIGSWLYRDGVFEPELKPKPELKLTPPLPSSNDVGELIYAPTYAAVLEAASAWEKWARTGTLTPRAACPNPTSGDDESCSTSSSTG